MGASYNYFRGRFLPTPPTVPANQGALYFKSDGKLYKKIGATETLVEASPPNMHPPGMANTPKGVRPVTGAVGGGGSGGWGGAKLSVLLENIIVDASAMGTEYEILRFAVGTNAIVVSVSHGWLNPMISVYRASLGPTDPNVAQKLITGPDTTTLGAASIEYNPSNGSLTLADLNAGTPVTKSLPVGTAGKGAFWTNPPSAPIPWGPNATVSIVRDAYSI